MMSLAVLFALKTLQGELIEVRQREKPLEIIKQSPLRFPPNKKPYEFEWLTEGYVRARKGTNEPQLRFRVFSQDRKVHSEQAQQTAQLLLRLWTYNFNDLKIDHKPDYAHSCVDVYLCFSGDPGGEQLFDEDPQAKGISSKVNTIYIYDLPSFKQPLEKVREICHEYGHASLPAIGGYDKPEYWANGYLGEKLFMNWLASQPNLTSDQLFGCDPAVLKTWVSKTSTPLITKGATNYPATKYLVGKSADFMNHYIGLMLWMQIVLPPKILSQSMKLMRTYNPKDVPVSLVEAAEGAEPFAFTAPSYLVGKTVWLPFGHLRISGATITARNGGWISITAPKTPVSVY
ncbi:MAG: hypothetical protein WCI55_05400 [Armatimonadota bacterium]